MDESEPDSICAGLAKRVAREAARGLGKESRCPSNLRQEIIAYAVTCQEPNATPFGDRPTHSLWHLFPFREFAPLDKTSMPSIRVRQRTSRRGRRVGEHHGTGGRGNEPQNLRANPPVPDTFWEMSRNINTRVPGTLRGCHWKLPRPLFKFSVFLGILNKGAASTLERLICNLETTVDDRKGIANSLKVPDGMSSKGARHQGIDVMIVPPFEVEVEDGSSTEDSVGWWDLPRVQPGFSR